MHARTAQPFFLSVLLHAAAVALVVWIAWRIAAPAVQQTHIFEVPPGEPTSGESPGNGSAGALSSSTTASDVSFKPLPIPAPRIAPTAAQQPAPAPNPVVVASPPVAVPAVLTALPTTSIPVTPPVAPTAVRAPETPRASTGKPMTLTEFRKTHPAPATKPAPAPAPLAPAAPGTRTAPAAAPSSQNPAGRIDVNNILASRGTGNNSDHGNSAGGRAGTREGLAPTASSDPAGEGGERDSFLARLSQKLREAHRKPEGMDDGLRASVAFALQENGNISDVRIAKTSGDEAFDASAVAAFKLVTALGRPPTSLVGANVIVFRTTTD